MSFFARIFGAEKRKRNEQLQAVRELVASGRPRDGWLALKRILRHDPHDAALALAAQLCTLDHDPRTAELFARVAQAPHDVPACLELGTHLNATGHADIARSILERALGFAPFDAVLRSELALSESSLGRPQDVLATLALHPCLADDPGALSLFAWSLLLTGDLDAAEESLATLRQHGAAQALAAKLTSAIARARMTPTDATPDARDWLFIEHASVLLRKAPHPTARFGALTVDGDWVTDTVSCAAAALEAMGLAARDVIPASERARELAFALAERSGGRVAEDRPGRLPRGIIVAVEAAELDAVKDRFSPVAGETVGLALVMPYDLLTRRTPEIVGAVCRAPSYAEPWSLLQPSSEPSPSVVEEADAVRAFVASRAEHLPPRAERLADPYVPDPPLAWP